MAVYVSDHRISRPNYLGGGQWVLRSLRDVTVLMGKNGSGKSVLLRAWRDQLPDTVHYVVPERTGDIAYQPQYLNDEFDGARRRGISGRNFVEQYRQRVITRIQAYFMNRGNFRGEGPTPGKPRELE